MRSTSWNSDAAELGFEVIEREEDEDGEMCLFLGREQAADDEPRSRR